MGWLGRRIERPSLSETIAMKRPGFSAAAGSTPVLRAESWDTLRLPEHIRAKRRGSANRLWHFCVCDALGDRQQQAEPDFGGVVQEDT